MRPTGVGRVPQVLGLVSVLICPAIAMAQVSFERYRALGDSLSHGTQGGLIVDYRTQPRAWPVLLAGKMGTTFRLPLLEKANLFSLQRREDYPSYETCHNLACNGADVDDTYDDTCQEIGWWLFGWDTNFENLVLAPRYGQSQVSAAVADDATFVTYFLGGNDFLKCILRYGTVLAPIEWLGVDPEPLGGKSPTSQTDFYNRYKYAITQLYASGRGICVGTFPTLENIAGVLDKEELTAIVGPNPMPEDCYTNEIVMAAILRAWIPAWNVDMVANDDNYYTPAELQEINDAVIGFNATIRAIAADPNHPCAVADVEQLINDLAAGDIHVNGWRINDQYLINNVGKPRTSVYSSDGVHPSDIGHALMAATFIDAINDFYGTSIPQFTEGELTAILNNDRFADNDGDGEIEGLDYDELTEAFYYNANFFLGGSYTGDSGEVPRAAKMLTVENTNPGFGYVLTTPEGPEHFENASVTLTAYPDVSKGRLFSHWEGDVPGGSTTQNPLTLTMDTDKTVVAVFKCGGTGPAAIVLTMAMMLGMVVYHRMRRA